MIKTLKELVTNPEKNSIGYIYVPLMNPDGYQYALKLF